MKREAASLTSATGHARLDENSPTHASFHDHARRRQPLGPKLRGRSPLTDRDKWVPAAAMKYARALPSEVEHQLADKPVAYVPWGALEWHGEHMALGQDALKVEALCDMAAAKTGGLVLPLLFIGYHTMQLYGMPFTLEFSKELVKTTFLELARQLERAGFKLIVVLCGHYGRSHLAAITEAAEEYARTGQAKVIALPEYALVGDLGYQGDHAAKWETSIFSSLYPELVKMERLPKDLNTPLKGVWGEDPRAHASPELGAKTISAIVERLAQRVEAALTQA